MKSVIKRLAHQMRHDNLSFTHDEIRDKMKEQYPESSDSAIEEAITYALQNDILRYSDGNYFEEMSYRRVDNTNCFIELQDALWRYEPDRILVLEVLSLNGEFDCNTICNYYNMKGYHVQLTSYERYNHARCIWDTIYVINICNPKVSDCGKCTLHCPMMFNNEKQ